MRDATDRTKIKDNADSQVSDVNALTVGRLAVPATVATQRTMMSFPTLDVEQKPLNTLLLLEGTWSKADRQALRVLFNRAKSKSAASSKA